MPLEVVFFGGLKIALPSDTKLLLTKNYFEIILFGKLRISCVIFRRECLSFLDISRAPKSLKNYEKKFSGNYFRNNFVSEGISGVLESKWFPFVGPNSGQ